MDKRAEDFFSAILNEDPADYSGAAKPKNSPVEGFRNSFTKFKESFKVGRSLNFLSRAKAPLIHFANLLAKDLRKENIKKGEAVK